MRSARPLSPVATIVSAAAGLSNKPPHGPDHHRNNRSGRRRALTASGSLAGLTAGLTAAVSASAQSQTDLDFGGDGSGIIIGQTLLGAIHGHQSGLTHSHQPLTQSPLGPNHAHTVPAPLVSGMAEAMAVPGPFAIAATNNAAFPAPLNAPGTLSVSASAPAAISSVTMQMPVTTTTPEQAPVHVPALAPTPALSQSQAILVPPQPTAVTPTPATLAGEPILIAGHGPLSYSPMTSAPNPSAGHGLLALSVGGLAGLGGAMSLLPRLDGINVPQPGNGFVGTGYSIRRVDDDSFLADLNAPRFTSSNLVSIDEGSIGAFFTVGAQDPQSDTVTYTISGGSDANRFSIDEASGALFFVGGAPAKAGSAADSRPDFSAQTGDADGTLPAHGDNSLRLQIKAADPASNSSLQHLVFALRNDVSDDVVLSYELARNLTRLPHNETDGMHAITYAGLGADGNGEALLVSIDGTANVRVTDLDGQGGASGATFGTAGTTYHDLAVDDLDRDGRLDVALVGETDSTGANILEIWSSDGKGQFSRKLYLVEGSSSSPTESSLDASGELTQIIIGEFDGHGHLDLFVGSDGGRDSVISLSGSFAANISSTSLFDGAQDSVLIDEAYISVSTDFVVGLADGDLTYIDPRSANQVELQAGSYQALTSHRDIVLAARDDRVDVFEADGNSLDLETTGLVTGADNITDLIVGDFDDNPDRELAVLDSGLDLVRIYDLTDDFSAATLLFTMEATDDAQMLLNLPAWTELASVEQGNLADDLLIGGNTSQIFYDDTAL